MFFQNLILLSLLVIAAPVSQIATEDDAGTSPATLPFLFNTFGPDKNTTSSDMHDTSAEEMVVIVVQPPTQPGKGLRAGAQEIVQGAAVINQGIRDGVRESASTIIRATGLDVAAQRIQQGAAVAQKGLTAVTVTVRNATDSIENGINSIPVVIKGEGHALANVGRGLRSTVLGFRDDNIAIAA